MSDKLKAGVSVKVVFSDGESPRAAKFNSISAQLDLATKRLEQAIGDIHNESYPYSTLTNSNLSDAYGYEHTDDVPLENAVTRPLDISNLGRLIGPASNLNPHMLGASFISETVPTGVHEFCLKYLPDGAVAFSDTSVFATEKVNISGVNSTGEYYVDSYGRVYTFDETNGGTAFYTTDPTSYGGGLNYQNASFNVIPDIHQLELGVGCTVGALDGEGRHLITLPTVTHHHYSEDESGVVLSLADPTYLHQLTLPQVLIDSWSAEEAIPGGFLFLKNYTNNVIYKTASYYYYNSTSVLLSGEDLTDAINAGDVFCIVTVGTNITSSIDDLRKKSYHSHNRHFGEPLIPIESLSGIFSQAGNSGLFLPSSIGGNHFPQYLHRDGHTSGIDNNINDENMMRGDLALGVEGAAAGDHRSAIGASYKLKFWGSAGRARPEIYRDSVSGFVLDPDQGSSAGRYSNPTVKGVRIRNGNLIPEGGIHSGLGTSEYAVKTIGFAEDAVAWSSFFWGVDFSTYGLDVSLHRVLGVSVLARNVGGTFVLPGSDGYEAITALYDYDAVSPFVLTILPVGVNWLNPDPIDIRGVLYFYEIVS